MSTDWLAELKAGDTVILSGFGGADTLGKVDRVTATQIVVNTLRFNKDNGSKRGGSSRWAGRIHLVQPTPERVEGIKRREYVNQLIGLSREHLNTLSTDLLLASVAVLCKTRNAAPA